MLVYVTGISGSGKSAVLEELRSRGFPAYGVDEDGYGKWLRRGSSEEEAFPEDRQDFGIRFGPDTDGNQIRANSATGNAEFDCHDESTGTSTAGTANVWVNNDGGTDQPNGICP